MVETGALDSEAAEANIAASKVGGWGNLKTPHACLQTLSNFEFERVIAGPRGQHVEHSNVSNEHLKLQLLAASRSKALEMLHIVEKGHFF